MVIYVSGIQTARRLEMYKKFELIREPRGVYKLFGLRSLNAVLYCFGHIFKKCFIYS